MSREIVIPAQQVPERKAIYRTISIQIQMPENGPYILIAQRELVTFEGEKEIKRIVNSATPVRKDFILADQDKFSDDENLVLAKLSDLVDKYAEEAGEGKS